MNRTEREHASRTGSTPVSLKDFITGKTPAIISVSGEYIFRNKGKYILIENVDGYCKVSTDKARRILSALRCTGEIFIPAENHYKVFPVGDRGEYHSPWTVETDRADIFGLAGNAGEFYWNVVGEYSTPD